MEFYHWWQKDRQGFTFNRIYKYVFTWKMRQMSFFDARFSVFHRRSYTNLQCIHCKIFSAIFGTRCRHIYYNWLHRWGIVKYQRCIPSTIWEESEIIAQFREMTSCHILYLPKPEDEKQRNITIKLKLSTHPLSTTYRWE